MMHCHGFFSKVSLLILLVMISLSARPLAAQADECLVFASDRDGNREIYTMKSDGSDVQRLTFNEHEDREPVWSPDRTQIAFASNQTGTWGIYIMGADGTNPRRITPDDVGFYDSPTWSPDGLRLAFVSDRAGGLGIFVISVTGGQPISLTPTDSSVEYIEPHWSPDGKYIAYASNKSGYFDIYMMKSEGGGEQAFTNGQLDYYSPAWSPDGKQIAYSANGNNFSEIYTVAIETNEQKLILAAEGYYADSVTWSPDGQQLAYVVWSAQENRSVRVVNLDGSTLSQLTSTDFNAGWVNWHSAAIFVEAGTLITYDDFSSNLLRWETYEAFDLVSTVSNGVYVIDFSDSDYEYWVVAPGYEDWATAPFMTQPYEMSFEISNTYVSDGAFNLVILFDVQQNYDSFKRFYVESNGEWQLVRWSNGHTRLAEGTLLNFVNLLDGATHTVTLRVQQSDYEVLIDGVLVITTPRVSQINGSVGFGLDRSETRSTRLYAEFDNLSIRLIE